MSWQGANRLRKKQKKQNESTRETVEAAVNRLVRAYQAAMECMGSCQGDIAVAHVARRTIEEALLKDSWIHDTYARRWSEAVKSAPNPEEIEAPRSKGQQDTVRQLAYLSLVNYAELLLGGCNYRRDSGVYAGLVKVWRTDTIVGWATNRQPDGSLPPEGTDLVAESNEESTRIALCAYMDAVDIDDTDPIIWLKLAQTARRLGSFTQPDSVLHPFRRLEREALERAVTVYPDHQPPNRRAVRALKCFEQEVDEAKEYPPKLLERRMPIRRSTLSIPRSSWPILGRLLLRSCKDGSGPASLHLAPVLTLSNKSWGLICPFLEKRDIGKLEMTCKAMMTAMVTARATVSQKVTEKVAPETETVQSETAATTNLGSSVPAEDKPDSTNEDGEADQLNRSSKRLKTQERSTGIRSERQFLRESLEYCLTAAVLGCKANHPGYLKLVARLDPCEQGANKVSSGGQVGDQRKPVTPEFAMSSLSSFTDEWKDRRGQAQDIMFHFLHHIAINAGDIYKLEFEDSKTLTQVILQCYEHLIHSVDNRRSLFTTLHQAVSQQNAQNDFAMFVIDLLYAELHLSLSMKDKRACLDIDSSFCIASRYAAYLHSVYPAIQSNLDSTDHDYWKTIKIRCLWLHARVFLERSRMEQSVTDARIQENIAMKSVDQMIVIMQADTSLRWVQLAHLAPHLGSSSRREISLVSLESLKASTQASSVLRQCQETFLAQAVKLSQQEAEKPIPADAREAFVEIASDLRSRYVDRASYIEILLDFLQEHGDVLLGACTDPLHHIGEGEDVATAEEWFDEIVPLSTPTVKDEICILQNPCILSIFMCCLHYQGEPRLIFESLVLTCQSAVDYTKGIINGMETPIQHFNRHDDDNESSSDDSVSFWDSDSLEDQDQLKRVSVFIRLLLQRLVKVGSHLEKKGFSDDETMVDLLQSVVEINSYLFLNSFSHAESIFKVDIEILESVQDIVQLFSQWDGTEQTYLQLYGRGLCLFFVAHRYVISYLQTSEHHTKNKHLDARIDTLINISFELSLLLAEHRFRLSETGIVASDFLSDKNSTHLSACMTEALVWTWRALCSRKVLERLRIPIACLVITFCCSCATSITAIPDLNDHVDARTLYDSDSSAVKTHDGTDESSATTMLHLVHSISCAFRHVSETEMSSYDANDAYQTPRGPLLPLVTLIALNHVADEILNKFGSGVWEEYPYGMRAIGQVIDDLLCKAYQCVYGFDLVTGSEDDWITGYGRALGSATEGASLYRCIMRMKNYSQGRKPPPKRALDLILKSLPQQISSAQNENLMSYLFHPPNPDDNLLNNIERFLRKDEGWKIDFVDIQPFFDAYYLSTVREDEDFIRIRKGVAQLTTQVALPYAAETGNTSDHRVASVINEKNFSKRFRAVFESLKMGDLADYEAWYLASECLALKANMILDRIGCTRGFCSTTNLFPETQLEEFPERTEGPIEQVGLGADLSFFIDYHWSSFASLQECAKAIGSSLNMKKGLAIWKRIDQLRLDGRFHEWQNAWAGIFIESLRVLSFRCIRIALYVLYTRPGNEDSSVLVSEITEHMGVSIYCSLMGSQVVGYQMREMTTVEKRKLATAALACIETSIKACPPFDQCKRSTWDIKFLAGKLHEKLAKTHWKDMTLNNDERRLYEVHLQEALRYFSTSASEAKLLEANNEMTVNRKGGSSHGSVELFYRIHAVRLKSLVAATAEGPQRRSFFEEEALRISEEIWFVEPESPAKDMSIRERMWNVLCDATAAFTSFRKDHLFFHRSVYRQAQAILWAPKVLDPDAPFSTAVPSEFASRLEGYSENTLLSVRTIIGSLFDKKRPQLCAVWNTSVSSSSCFEAINDSVRKYDCLRGKYIAAYIQCLEKVDARSDLETFLKWVQGSKRDLPSYFAMSANPSDNSKKHRPHTEDPLLRSSGSLKADLFLTTVKRLGNVALAKIIGRELRDKETTSAEDVKTMYACYLRLNSRPSECVKRSFYDDPLHGPKPIVSGLISVLQRHKSISVLSQGGWGTSDHLRATFRAVVAECKSMFPHFKSGFPTKRKPKRKEPPKEENIEAVKEVEATQEPAPKKTKMYEVTIPDGLSEGNTFVSIIRDGANERSVRLTVPAGRQSTLRFELPTSSS